MHTMPLHNAGWVNLDPAIASDRVNSQGPRFGAIWSIYLVVSLQ